MRLACVLALLASLTSACIQSGLVPCGEKLCAVDDVCLPSGQCASHEEVDVCASKADGDACATTTIVDGTCHGGACRGSRCGNEIVDLGEACDDGNQTFGDGCSGDCRSLEVCGNTIVDRIAGEDCDDGNTVDTDGCRADCTVPVCGDGTIDSHNGEACDDGIANSIAPGAKCRPNCQASRCGDGVVDPQDVCDDGNTLSGDNCSADCKSLEVCGNGIVDLIKGEQCDEPLAELSGDGCTSSCKVEFQLWRQIAAGGIPDPRSGGAAAFHPSLGVMIFGGQGSAIFDDTWSWDGLTWAARSAGPLGRRFFDMTYDSDRGRIVMYGGQPIGGGTVLGDTWEHDGVRWRQRSATSPPGTRRFGALAYDAKRHRVVMWGGLRMQDSTSLVDETWEWDGVTWTQVTTAHKPPGRFRHRLAYDAERQVVVLFGGQSSTAFLNDTWTYDGVDWTQQFPSTVPSNRGEHMMVYDPIAKQTIMYGGFGSGTSSETWAWNGADWSPLSPATIPPARFGTLATYDPKRSRIVMFGGSVTTIGNTSEIWEWDGTNWALVPPEAFPGGAGSLAYDARRGRSVFFNGTATWEWDGGAWHKGRGSNPTGARTTLPLAYDEKRGEVLLFGGSSSLADTWTYDGTTWTQRAPATVPSPRDGPALAYDRARDRIVMFGGATPLNAETWEWNGSNWLLRAPSTAPLARTRAMMAYDPIRERTVLFGGSLLGANVVGDTWEWDGTSWTNVATTGPGARSEGNLVYDPRERAVVLIGGIAGGGTMLADTWAWDGTTWKQLAPVVSVTKRLKPGVASDVTGGIVLAGGVVGATANVDLWRLRFESDLIQSEACASDSNDDDGDGKAGCADIDCWSRCNPLCPPSTSCSTTLPYCGDGTCGPVEDAFICPADCGP